MANFLPENDLEGDLALLEFDRSDGLDEHADQDVCGRIGRLQRPGGRVVPPGIQQVFYHLRLGLGPE